MIHETAAGLNEERQYLELAQRHGLPNERWARNQMIESHRKIIANLEKDMEEPPDLQPTSPIELPPDSPSPPGSATLSATGTAAATSTNEIAGVVPDSKD
jgi:hypothetical protein